MRCYDKLCVAVIAGLLSSDSMLRADEPPTAAEIRALRQQIEELERKVKALEERNESKPKPVEPSEKQAPTISMTEQGFAGFVLNSPEKDFTFRLRGYVQADARFYIGDNIPINDTFLVRRMRPVIEGTVFQDYDYRIMLDVASRASITAGNNSLLQDAVVNAHYWPQFQVQLGKFKPAIGYEHLQSDANLLLLERDYPSELVPNREVGIEFHGEILGGRLIYALGAFNGVFDGGSE